MRRQKDILGAPPRGPDQLRNRQLKQALTRTHFTFGDEPMEYERTSTLPDPTSKMEEYTGVLNTEVKDMIKKTNLTFGNEPTVYRSMTAEQMDPSVLGGEARGPDAERNRLLKIALTRTHFHFGDEETEWKTDYQRGFAYDKEKTKFLGQSALAKQLKEDLSKTHFTMGNDKCEWETDAMSTQRAGERLGASQKEREEQAAKNRALKAELQSTHYEIGTDEDYL